MYKKFPTENVPEEDNLPTRDNWPVPNVSFAYCIHMCNIANKNLMFMTKKNKQMYKNVGMA